MALKVYFSLTVVIQTNLANDTVKRWDKVQNPHTKAVLDLGDTFHYLEQLKAPSCYIKW
jgi:hypothetical protein